MKQISLILFFLFLISCVKSQCTGGWVGVNCTICPSNWNETDNCSTCRHNWQDNSNNCSTCPGYWDPLNDCKTCVGKNYFLLIKLIGNWNESTDCTVCKYTFINDGKNCSTCPGKYDPLNNCLYCKGNWNETDDCATCENNFQDRNNTDCGYCPPHYDRKSCSKCVTNWEGINCTVCPAPYDPDKDCDDCFGNLDINSNCTKCLGKWSGVNCTVCAFPFKEVDGKCETCANSLLNKNRNCSECTYPYFDPSLNDLDNICKKCLEPLKDPFEICMKCLDRNYTFSSNCTVLKTKLPPNLQTVMFWVSSFFIVCVCIPGLCIATIVIVLILYSKMKKKDGKDMKELIEEEKKKEEVFKASENKV